MLTFGPLATRMTLPPVTHSAVNLSETFARRHSSATFGPGVYRGTVVSAALIGV
jgi:hypothetical protein